MIAGFSPAARTDLDQVWQFTFDRWGIEQADRYYKALESACIDLASGIRTGRRRVGLNAGYLLYRVQSHLVVYRPTPDDIHHSILIVRFLHFRMDIATQDIE